MNNIFRRLRIFRKNISFVNRKRTNFKFPALAFPLILIPKLAKLEDDKNELELKDITLGEYENRIRSFASIEKRFHVFANIKSSDDIKMNYFQFLYSMVPFQ